MNKYLVRFDEGDGAEFVSAFKADDYAHAEEQAKDYTDAKIVEIKLDTRVFYLHRFEVAMAYGGAEEGGWWYDTGIPTKEWVGPYMDEDLAFAACRELNEKEHERSEQQEYSYSSVLSYRSEHYAWDVSEDKVAKPYPERRPHYE
jgi:hypothetical protein